jgi:arginine/ornithine N-succinyltransferase beta subunit
MIRFWYLYLKEKYQDRIQLLLSDTDSYIYYLKAKKDEDPYEDMFDPENRHLFDLSEFDPQDPVFGKFYNDENKKELGKFKVESAKDGAIEKVIYLKPKMYSYKTSKNVTEVKAKGIPTRFVKRNYTYEDYVKVLETGCQTIVENTSIRSIRHQLYTTVTTKKGLNSFCGKRYMVDKYSSLAYGNKRIKLE